MQGKVACIAIIGMGEHVERQGGIFFGVVLEVDGTIVDPAQLLDARFGLTMLHSPIQWVIGVEVGHALEIDRLGPWRMDHDIF